MNKVSLVIPTRVYLLHLAVFGVFLAGALWLITSLFAAGLVPLGSALSGIVVFLALIFLRRKFTPLRWLAIGIALALLFTLYPLLYTLFLSVTNMGSGHLMAKQQALARYESELYLPAEGETYRWAAYQAGEGAYALWLIGEDGTGRLAVPGAALQAVEGVGALDSDGFPESLAGYERLPLNRTVPLLSQLSAIDFGEAPDAIRIRSLREAAALQPRYRYDAAQDALIDLETGAVYRPVEGTFTSESGEELPIGFIDTIGIRHFQNFLGSEGFREPLISMMLWNISFAFCSVLFSFVVGLVVTLLFEDLPGKRVIRALLIIPWPIPVLISILIWRSMLNPDLGFVAPVLEAIFGASPEWFSNPLWTRVAVILVNVWLSYPYFYVITAGAIRSIPREIYDAAVVDGAGGWNKLYHITLPLLLRVMMPLLIASFTFNFNNFNVIYIFNFGNPPMPNTIVPMGYTDILISFVYRLAFISSNITNYGLAAAITVLLFLLVSVLVIVQLRFTRLFKEAV
ncbi:MAG: ABC transporter permease subunit [Anaerolineae bacterium]|nr:ABC transporter permease subunit [Anaerolineae bacterium]NUQ06157.1 ABC transporter permease subunit [Anaerolineae bacterium]